MAVGEVTHYQVWQSSHDTAVVRVRYLVLRNRSYCSTVVVLEVAHTVHGREGALEAECNHPRPAGDLTGMMEEDTAEGRMVPGCCSCCVSLKAEDLVDGHICRNA